MPLRSGTEHQATSSNSRARNGHPPRPPGLTIPEVPREDVHHEAVDAADGAATVRLTPDVYARFQEFQNLPTGEWEQFQLFREFMQMRGQPAAVTPEAAVERPAPPPQVHRAIPVVIPPGETQGRSFDSFLGARPPQFLGAPDVVAASNWLIRIEDIFKRIACAPEFKVSHATYHLEDAARFWWQGVERRFEARGVEPTWDDFVSEFERKYCTAHIRAQKKIELLTLKQGNMRIPEYEAKFSELGRFIPELLETDAEQMFHFERGMDPDLVVQVRGCRCTSLTDMIEQAARLKDAMIAARGTSQKRSRDEPAQSQPQFGGNSSGSKKKKFHPSSSESSGGSSFQQWFCKKCKKRHSRGRACDGSPLTCHTYGKQGHISPMCRSGGRQQSQSWSQSFHRQTSSHQQGSGRQ
ncbi:hypothetical protein Dimus_037880 [Dionaea muscipula]